MATKKLYIDANTGTMLIASESLPITNDVLVGAPVNYAENLYFHSGLDYAQIRGLITPAFAVNFAAVERELVTWSDGSKGCGGGCFITEACAESLGLADDCYELTTLRNFRDTYMSTNAESLIDEYYDTAPKVVAFIKRQGKSKSKLIFTELYENYVLPSVKAIETGDFKKALELYKTGCYKAQELAGL
jgi:hypothetical protein